MKIAVCFLVLLPLIYSVSLHGRLQERFWVQPNIHDLLTENHILEHLKTAMGSNTTMAACEHVCPSVIAIIPGSSVFSSPLCHIACTDLLKTINV